MKKSKLIVLVLSVLLAGTILVTNDNLFKAETTDDTVIVEGVYIGGINVSGMTVEEARTTVNEYVEELKTTPLVLQGPNAEIALTYADLGFEAKVEAAVAQAGSLAQSGNLIRRFMAMQDLKSDNVVIDMGFSIDKTAVADMIYKKIDELNIVRVDNTVKKEGNSFKFIAGSAGAEVDIVKAVNELSDFVTKDCQQKLPEIDTYVLASNVLEPRGTEEEFAQMKDIIGTYSTIFVTSTPERAQNVTNGCAKVNGTVVLPGDIISIHDLTAPYDAEHGYEKAGSYANGKIEYTYGGGICQVSTTMYGAALNAEIEIYSRSAHSMTVDYCPVSGDAAIAGDYKDLKLRNDQDYPIYIEGICVNGVITFNIYGKETRPANRTFEFETEILKETLPNSKYNLDPEKPVGHILVLSGEHIGYSAEYWKVIYVDGKETERVKINRSWYAASDGEHEIGIKGATKEQLDAINEAIATKDVREVIKVVQGFGIVIDPNNPNGTTPGGTTDNTTNNNTNQGTTTDKDNTNNDSTTGGTTTTPEDDKTPEDSSEGDKNNSEGNGDSTGTSRAY